MRLKRSDMVARLNRMQPTRGLGTGLLFLMSAPGLNLLAQDQR